MVQMGRMAALKKTTGVCGIVAGDIVRRLVAKTISHQIRVQVEKATAFQYALSTRAGCECNAHALQTVTDAHPEATILSVDGISACDSISRVSMMQGDALLPFVNQFYGSPSTYLWEDDEGRGCSRRTVRDRGHWGSRRQDTGGVPTGAQALTGAVRRSDLDAIVWRGDSRGARGDNIGHSTGT